MATINKNIKRREYVNKEYGDFVRGTNISNSQKAKLLKKLWKEAKKKYK